MSAFSLGLLVARLKFIHERESISDGVWNLSVSGFKPMMDGYFGEDALDLEFIRKQVRASIV